MTSPTRTRLLHALQRDQAAYGVLYLGRTPSMPLTAQQLLDLAGEVDRARRCHADPVASLMAWNGGHGTGGKMAGAVPRVVDRRGWPAGAIPPPRWARFADAVERGMRRAG